MLADGERPVLIGGFGPEYDVITPVRVSAGSVEPAGIRPQIACGSISMLSGH